MAARERLSHANSGIKHGRYYRMLTMAGDFGAMSDIRHHFVKSRNKII